MNIRCFLRGYLLGRLAIPAICVGAHVSGISISRETDYRGLTSVGGLSHRRGSVDDCPPRGSHFSALRRCRDAVIAEKGPSQANIPATGAQQMKIKSVLKDYNARCQRCHPSWISCRFLCAFIFAACIVIPAIGQQIAAPDPQPGKISGTVTDVNDDIVPGANVILESASPGDRRSTVSGDNGSFAFDDLKPGVPYHVTINADGFVTWTSPAIMARPGQYLFLTGSKPTIARGSTSATVYTSSKQIAAEH